MPPPRGRPTRGAASRGPARREGCTNTCGACCEGYKVGAVDRERKTTRSVFRFFGEKSVGFGRFLKANRKMKKKKREKPRNGEKKRSSLSVWVVFFGNEPKKQNFGFRPRKTEENRRKLRLSAFGSHHYATCSGDLALTLYTVFEDDDDD